MPGVVLYRLMETAVHGRCQAKLSLKPCNIVLVGNFFPGDIEEMEHQDGGEEGKEKLTEVDPCHSEGCMQVESARDLQPCKKQHFTFSLVNSSGTSEINSIVEGKILKLNGNYFIAVFFFLPSFYNCAINVSSFL